MNISEVRRKGIGKRNAHGQPKRPQKQGIHDRQSLNVEKEEGKDEREANS